MIGARLRRACLAAALLLGGTAAVLAETPPEPRDYRLADYRAATPATLAGAEVVTTQKASALWKDKAALFIDVLPHVPKPANLPAGTLWRDPPHDTIEGAVWLPEVGRGALA